MEKKTYYIPMVEIIRIEAEHMMDQPLAGSGTHSQAPKRRDPVF